MLGLLLVTQTPVQVAARPANLGVRAWLPDTLLPVGAPARVYVQLEDSGYLALLHVEPSGRIRVLYPVHPTDPDYVPGGATFIVEGISDSTTFRVTAPGTGTLLAVRSWTPLRFAGLANGSRWDYENSLLLQPTAGNPFAALLDIADRMANGEAYTYDLAGYRTPGVLAGRRTTTDSVCGNCFTVHHPHADAAYASGDGDAAAIAIDHSMAASGNGSVVDCSYATLTSSFCGVDNSVDNSVTYQEPTATPVASANAYAYPDYPLGYFPFFFSRRRTTPPPPPLPPPAIALNLRAAARATVPAVPPPRRIPRIIVTQPTAPSHPSRVSAVPPPTGPQQTAAPAATAAPGMRRFAVARPVDAATRNSAAAPAGSWSEARVATVPMSRPAPMTVAAPAMRAGASPAAAAAPGRAIVPSHAAVERARGH